MKVEKFEIGKTYEGIGEVAGVDFTLLKRKEDLCIFKRGDDWYEVVQVEHRKERKSIFKGIEMISRGGEVYRQGDKWNGKIVKTIERAEEIFNEKIFNKDSKKWNFNN